MPVTNMTEEEQAKAISQLEPDLGAVFEEDRVRRDVQAALATMDAVDCKTFVRIEETSTALGPDCTMTSDWNALEQTRLQWRRSWQHGRRHRRELEHSRRKLRKNEVQASQRPSQAGHPLQPAGRGKRTPLPTSPWGNRSALLNSLQSPTWSGASPKWTTVSSYHWPKLSRSKKSRNKSTIRLKQTSSNKATKQWSG